MNLALVTSKQREFTDDDSEPAVNIGTAADQSAVSATLRRVIDRSPTRYKLNLLAVLWPPVMTVLECITRRAYETLTPSEAEEIVGRALVAGLRAADGVSDYTAPAWPMRNVDAFMNGLKEYADGRNVLPCKGALTACDSLPACRSVAVQEAASETGAGGAGSKRIVARSAE